MGIDPGLKYTGYGVVALDSDGIEPRLVEAGVIKLDSHLSLEYRLDQLHIDLSAVLDEFKPDYLVVEKLFAHYKHPRTAILMAHARGVIMLAARQCGVLVEHLPATEVKRAVTGNGHASKQQIQLAVQTQCRLSVPPNPPDVADAIGIALTFARRVALARL